MDTRLRNWYPSKRKPFFLIPRKSVIPLISMRVFASSWSRGNPRPKTQSETGGALPHFSKTEDDFTPQATVSTASEFSIDNDVHTRCHGVAFLWIFWSLQSMFPQRLDFGRWLLKIKTLSVRNTDLNQCDSSSAVSIPSAIKIISEERSDGLPSQWLFWVYWMQCPYKFMSSFI
jgi:hypothetical protein